MEVKPLAVLILLYLMNMFLVGFTVFSYMRDMSLYKSLQAVTIVSFAMSCSIAFITVGFVNNLVK